MIYTQKDLDEMLAKFRAQATVKVRFLRPVAGGVPASDDALKAFIQHHLHIAPETPKFEEAFSRIRHDEIGEKETTPETGEVKTEEVYAVNTLRKSPQGPWVADHQLKALIKQAASRLNLFVKNRGSKGDIAEMGTVLACGESLMEEDKPWQIHPYVEVPGKGIQPPVTHFDILSGSVQTPMGKKSICHHTEVLESGAIINFQIRWPDGKLKAKDMALIIAAASQIGLGSCLSLGYGRFEVVEFTA